MGFSIVFVNVIIMLFYLTCGFALVKFRKGEASHAKTLSGLLIYVCCPAMIINSFQTMEYSAENFKKISLFFLTSLVLQLMFFALIYLFLHKKYDDAKYRILTVGALLGNVGFFGLPVVTALFPNDSAVACYSSVYVMSMNLLVFTVGVFMITGERRYVSLKSALLNPTTLSVLAALPLYLLNIHFPAAMDGALSLLGGMTTPLCMFVLGMRLAAGSLKKLFTRGFVYIACALKLIVFPLFAYACVFFLPFFDETFKISILVLSAAPSGAVILSLAELHECEQELTANVVLATTLLSVITMPLMLLIAQ